MTTNEKIQTGIAMATEKYNGVLDDIIRRAQAAKARGSVDPHIAHNLGSRVVELAEAAARVAVLEQVLGSIEVG